MCEKLGLSWREKHRLRVFENRVLRKIFGCNRDEVTGTGGEYIERSLMICTPHQILIGWSFKKDKMGGTCDTLRESRGAYRVLVGKPEGKGPIVRHKCRWKYNITMDLQEICWGVWIGLIWFRTRWWIFEFREMWGISLLAEKLEASQGLCSM